MKKAILLGLILVSFVGYSQKELKNSDSESGEIVIDVSHTDMSKEDKNNPNQIYTAVETSPSYPGGMNEFRKFIAQNYRAPEVIHDLKGNVLVTFIVETDGSLSDIQVIRDLGYGTGAEAIRVLKKSKKWIAGVQSGRPVRVKYTLPININIQGNPPVIKPEE